MSNPLLDKYFELYPEKKEEPKKVEYEIDSAAVDDYLKFVKSYRSDPNIPLTTQSVATSNTGITKASNPFATYADDLKVSFLQVAEQLQTGKAQIASINVDMNNHLALKRITFEVMVYEP
jgi:hypothetical protein